MAWTAVAGAATASLGGALLNSGTTSGSTDTTSRAPWAPAQPWLQNNINTGQNLQDYYQSHPLNSMQQQGYQNLAGNLDNWNSSTAPALQSVANRLMGSNYSRTIGQSNYQQPSIGNQFQSGGMQGGGMQGGGMQGAMGGYMAGLSSGGPQWGNGPSYGQAMGNNSTMSMGGNQGGLLGPAIQQQFTQPQMDVTQGQGLYGLLNWSDLMPDVNKLNKDAQAAANSKKPKADDSTSTTNQWTDNTGGGGM